MLGCAANARHLREEKASDRNRLAGAHWRRFHAEQCRFDHDQGTLQDDVRTSLATMLDPARMSDRLLRKYCSAPSWGWNSHVRPSAGTCPPHVRRRDFNGVPKSNGAH